jgi:ABC-2 type transport system ATP-binding protein
VAEIVAGAGGTSVRVRTPQTQQLGDVLHGNGAGVTLGAEGELLVTGMPAPRIGELAAQHQLVLHELSPIAGTLEAAYMELTQNEVQYVSGGAPATTGGVR